MTHRVKRGRATVVPAEAARLRGPEANPRPELSREGALPREGEARVAGVPGNNP